jgi:signal transduction histidine kinase
LGSLELDRLEEIIERISEGVVVLDDALNPTLANCAAKRMLGLREKDLPPRLPSDELLVLARNALAGKESEEVLRLWFPDSRMLKARAMRLGSGGGVLVALQDVTEEHLAQRIRREFVAHASHELKSPVAGIQALAGAINQAQEDDPATVARFSERLVHETDRLGRLISDLLDLSRLDDPSRIPDVAVDLAAVARSEADGLDGDARAKDIKFVVSIPSHAWIRGDSQQLGVMVRNLLDNAIRYTHEGGSVRLEVVQEADEALVRIIDNGIGIPLESQGRVFERFYRVDRARSRERGGTGLGLAIVKHVADLHGGSVAVQSELGEGSAFTVRVPSLTSTSATSSEATG